MESKDLDPLQEAKQDTIMIPKLQTPSSVIIRAQSPLWPTIFQHIPESDNENPPCKLQYKIDIIEWSENSPSRASNTREPVAHELFKIFKHVSKLDRAIRSVGNYVG